jgi:hypothetical protein
VSFRHIELLTFPGLVRLADDRCEVFITMLADAGENRSSDARGTVLEPTAITSSKQPASLSHHYSCGAAGAGAFTRVRITLHSSCICVCAIDVVTIDDVVREAPRI